MRKLLYSILFFCVVSSVIINTDAKQKIIKSKIKLTQSEIADSSFFSQLYSYIKHYSNYSLKNSFYAIEIRDSDLYELPDFYYEKGIEKKLGLEILVSHEKYPFANSLVRYKDANFISHGWVEAYGLVKNTNKTISYKYRFNPKTLLYETFDVDECWKLYYYQGELMIIYYANQPNHYYINWRNDTIRTTNFDDIKIFEFTE